MASARGWTVGTCTTPGHVCVPIRRKLIVRELGQKTPHALRSLPLLFSIVDISKTGVLLVLPPCENGECMRNGPCLRTFSMFVIVQNDGDLHGHPVFTLAQALSIPISTDTLITRNVVQRMPFQVFLQLRWVSSWTTKEQCGICGVRRNVTLGELRQKHSLLVKIEP
ncbi:hypothetical protein BJX62DRAFT_109901 [Aspergillus germanicus]